MAKKPSLTSGGTLLTEIAWEVCNQVGGIYTVIRTKVPSMVERWSENYCLIGPYIHPDVTAEFEPVENYTDPFGKAVKEMRNQGFDVHYGRWLVTGRPRVVLVDPAQVYDQLDEIKYFIWKNHQIEIPGNDELVNQVLAFGHLVKIYLSILAKKRTKHAIITHFHEWMAATPIPSLRKEKVNVRIVFTTHATMLGRYLAGNDPKFYAHLPFFNWEDEARKFYISPQVKFERAAAHSSHVFTTVSDVTARECKHLLGKTPHVILPNGLNIERFDIQHEVQNVHHEYKQEINQFVMGHFFQSYSFDLENTLYFFTSGRYEYRNKGFDLTLEALKKLNLKMKRAKMNTTVVAFFITKKPYYSIDPKTMHSRGVLDEVRQTCDAIIKQVSDKLFKTTAASADYRLPVLNEFVSDYWKLRLRRTIQSWKSDETPAVCTHILKDEEGDDILNYLKSVNLMNSESDRVKIVYHADFISPTNPLFGIEYWQFVRGCHLGIFPSYYEPWGYTPLECIARAIPAVTSDLSGFGDYVLNNIPEDENTGIYVLERGKKKDEEAATNLAELLFSFVKLNKRERVNLRNQVERCSENFDWQFLTDHYDKAYQKALK